MKSSQNKDELVSVNTELEHQDLADARLFLATGDKTNIMRYKQVKCKSWQNEPILLGHMKDHQ